MLLIGSEARRDDVFGYVNQLVKADAVAVRYKKQVHGTSPGIERVYPRLMAHNLSDPKLSLAYA